MAHISTNPQAPAAHDCVFNRRFARIGEAQVSAARSTARYRQIEALAQLGDEQLAARGLTRADIVRHVFRDVIWM